MIFTEARLKGAFIIEIENLEDERGFFARAWCQREFEAHGLNLQWVQANLAFSKKRGTLRGLHYQVAPYEEAKLMRCTRGAIYDVIVDLRPESRSTRYRNFTPPALSEVCAGMTQPLGSNGR
jgi:dTDP-4-dehydrorhamnose 3,5-epimerase